MRRLLLPCAFFVAGLLTVGCAGMGTTRTDTGIIHVDEAEALAQRLRSEALRWEGTPHHLGGSSRQGADCSGLVKTVYADLFALDLPRTTSEQVQTGAEVRRDAWQPGDLVFFQISPRTRHVGIYVGDGEFFHVSSSRGATVSRLDAPYWRDRYWTARRVLITAPVLARTRTPASPAVAPSSAGGRAGW